MELSLLNVLRQHNWTDGVYPGMVARARHLEDIGRLTNRFAAAMRVESSPGTENADDADDGDDGDDIDEGYDTDD
ncbi:unnamed protein product [Phytophthora lilii]|uniref:Unnamed protein product n=1 Tax=Phytophthora lilii TaxID=2077276 RepID=A0A9W7CRK9_9STRA|nr:unnamed protein product [Phytophthora lilii]